MFLKTLLIAGLALASVAVQAADITIHGSTTVTANLFDPFKADLEKATGDTYTLVSNGSSRGIEGIDSGAAKIGMISAELSSVLKKMDKAGKEGDYKAEKVGEERIVYAVHSSNAVAELAKDKVVGILKGDIKNWKDVGGADAPIMVVTEYAGGGFHTTVTKSLLDGAKEIPAPEKRFLPNGPQAVKVGEQLPNAFVVIPSTMLKGSSLKTLKSDAEIVQPLYLVVKGAGDEHFTKLVDAAKAKLQ